MEVSLQMRSHLLQSHQSNENDMSPKEHVASNNMQLLQVKIKFMVGLVID